MSEELRTPEDPRLTLLGLREAVHEAAHAFICFLPPLTYFKNIVLFDQESAMEGDGILGSVVGVNDGEAIEKGGQHLYNLVCVLVAGAVAEHVFYGDELGKIFKLTARSDYKNAVHYATILAEQINRSVEPDKATVPDKIIEEACGSATKALLSESGQQIVPAIAKQLAARKILLADEIVEIVYYRSWASG